MIVKLQRPLASILSNPPWLIYNQDRSFQTFVQADRLPAHVHEAMTGRDIGYFEVGLLQVTEWGRILPDQDW